jgi:hypothetical protein
MNTTYKLPITERTVLHQPRYHRDSVIQESLDNGIIPDVVRNPFGLTVISHGGDVASSLDQRLPRIPHETKTLIGGSVMFLTNPSVEPIPDN